MPKINSRLGITGFMCRFYAIDNATGDGKTGLSSSSSGLVITTINSNENAGSCVSYTGANIESISVIGTWAAPTAGKIRFAEVSSTLLPGLYEVHVADARLAVAGSRSLIVQPFGVSGVRFAPAEFQLDSVPANFREILDVTLNAAFARSVGAIISGTVGTGSTTTSIVTSAMSIPGSTLDQFVNKLIVFAGDTTTAALRGQMSRITGTSNASLPVLTLSPALTNAPVSTDTFVIL